MLDNYNLNSVDDKKNAIKEIMQEVILECLSKHRSLRKLLL